MPPSGAPLKVSEASGGAGKLHVPKDIKELLDRHLPDARFTVRLTPEGILFAPVVATEPELEDLPDWLKQS